MRNDRMSAGMDIPVDIPLHVPEGIWMSLHVELSGWNTWRMRNPFYRGSGLSRRQYEATHLHVRWCELCCENVSKICYSHQKSAKAS